MYRQKCLIYAVKHVLHVWAHWNNSPQINWCQYTLTHYLSSELSSLCSFSLLHAKQRNKKYWFYSLWFKFMGVQILYQLHYTTDVVRNNIFSLYRKKYVRMYSCLKNRIHRTSKMITLQIKAHFENKYMYQWLQKYWNSFSKQIYKMVEIYSILTT